jgi:uncharacterized protein (DUF885 family)
MGLQPGLSVLVCGLLGVLAAPSFADSPDPRARDPAERVVAIGERWLDVVLTSHPLDATQLGDVRFADRFDVSIRDDVRERLRRATREALALLAEVDAASLDGEAVLDREVLEWRLRATLDSLRFPEHLLPVGPTAWSPPFDLARMAGKDGAQPFSGADDYDRWIRRVQGLEAWVETAIENMRRGIDGGVVQPRVLVVRTVENLDALTVDDPTRSPLYDPVRRIDDEIPKADRRRIARKLRSVIATSAVPAYRKLQDFLRDVYLESTTDSLSVVDRPGGREWYAHLIRRHTTTDLDAEAILRIGLREVERLTAEMKRAAERLGHDDVRALLRRMRTEPRFVITGRPEVLRAFRRLDGEVARRLPELFGRLPEQELRIHGVEPSEAAYTGTGVYVPASPDGSRPGVFYLGGGGRFPRVDVPWLYLHEGCPGHHLQISLARSNPGLPGFRRLLDDGAFVEGWALYAESLGDELGAYDDGYDEIARLGSELLRAARLVLDTGIHRGRWTAEQAAAWADSNAYGYGRFELERYASMPAQALSYKVGQLRILDLRERAERELEDRFDIREFHDELLRHGSLPLGVLEAQIDRWIARERSRPDGPAPGLTLPEGAPETEATGAPRPRARRDSIRRTPPGPPR